ncbi:MAG: hypothetical protein R2776_03680 [Flavobacteriaceae bacterium]|nr:hypothetical protein [Flavobacteriaceae bacterium]
MIDSKFKELANLYHTEYKREDYKVTGQLFSKLPITVYTIQIIHQNIPIDISFEFGNHNVADFKFKLDLNQRTPNFTITTLDNFSRIFRFHKNTWKIDCKDELMKSSLQRILRTSGFEDLAKKELFEPNIEAKHNSVNYEIKIFYYLGFNNKEDSLFLVTEFCKLLIDTLKNRYSKIL